MSCSLLRHGVRQVVLLAFGLTTAYAHAGQLVWSRTFPDGLFPFAVGVDADRRTGEGLLQFIDEQGRLVRVNLDGTETILPSSPIPDYGHESAFALVESSDGHQRILFGETAVLGRDGWIVPIPIAMRYTLDGTLRAVYNSILDWGLVSEDGSTFVSSADSLAGASCDAPQDVLSMVRFFRSDGTLINEIVDPIGRFNNGSLSPDGSVFAYFSGRNLVARCGDGTLLWTHTPESSLELQRGDGQIAVGRFGSYTAYSAWRDEDKTLVVKILGPQGGAIASVLLPALRPEILSFSPDATALAFFNTDIVRVLSVSQPSTIWTSTPGQPNFEFWEMSLANGAAFVALATKLDGWLEPYEPGAHPVQWRVRVVETASDTVVLALDIPRDDELVQVGAPSRGPYIRLADDGRYLWIGTYKTMSIYQLGFPGESAMRVPPGR